VRSLHIDPFGGMAGDMFLASLLDLGDDAFRLEDLKGFTESVVPGECELATREVRRGAFRGLWLDVRTSESADPPERHLAELCELLGRSSLGRDALARATGILERLAQAESEVHGVALEEVHFHEIGAVDTLIDVGGACLALERLGIAEVRSSVAFVGGGSIESAHGTLPVPTPGTAALLRGFPIARGPGGERVTPTGAALLAGLVGDFAEGSSPVQTVRAIGYGAGTRDPDVGPPNLVRVSLSEDATGSGLPRTEVWLLETNLDDATGEEIGFLVGELRRAGALEVWTSPVQMKKDRPGVIVSLLARPAERGTFEELLFRHSPTLGVRSTRWERAELLRSEALVRIEGRSVRVKVARRSEGPLRPADVSPAYDDVAELARSTGRPMREVEELVRRVALAELERGSASGH
jgi:uncharacterized protein (TIGR00299 family) protein